MAIEYTQQYAIYNSPQITNKTSEFWNQCYIFVCNLMDSLFQNNTSPIVRFLLTTNLKKFISFLLRVYIIQFSLWFLTSVIYLSLYHFILSYNLPCFQCYVTIKYIAPDSTGKKPEKKCTQLHILFQTQRNGRFYYTIKWKYLPKLGEYSCKQKGETRQCF